MPPTLEDSAKLFDMAAKFYARFRRPYPPAIIDFLIEQFSLDSGTRVLDLGCGTGQLAIPLALREVPVYAVDPNAEMLIEGICAEKEARCSGIGWFRGDDTRLLNLRLSAVQVCCMAASFHWMNRVNTLAALNQIVLPSGGVAVISGGGSVWSESGNQWHHITRELVVEFLGPKRRAGGATYQNPSVRHAVVLAHSVFSHVKSFSFRVSCERTVDEIVGLQLSTSYASPLQLGNRVADFSTALRERLLQSSPSGVFLDEFDVEVLLARRGKFKAAAAKQPPA